MLQKCKLYKVVRQNKRNMQSTMRYQSGDSPRTGEIYEVDVTVAEDSTADVTETPALKPPSQ